MSLAFWVEAQTGDTVILVRGDASALVLGIGAPDPQSGGFWVTDLARAVRAAHQSEEAAARQVPWRPPHLRDQLDRLAAQEGPSAREMYAQSRERDLQEQERQRQQLARRRDDAPPPRDLTMKDVADYERAEELLRKPYAGY